MLAVYAFHFRFITFQALRSFLASTPYTPFSLSLQAYTSAPLGLSKILISIPQATFIPFLPKPFPPLFQRYVFYFCEVSAPVNILLNCSLYALWAVNNTIRKSTKIPNIKTITQYHNVQFQVFILGSWF